MNNVQGFWQSNESTARINKVPQNEPITMDIVLIHGMGRTPLSMLLLSHRLSRVGHQPHLFAYSATLESLQHATDRLVNFIHRHAHSGQYACVGHSLGTVLIRNALTQLKRQPSACFFLAPPMAACKAAQFFSRFWPYQVINGEMGQRLAQADFMAQLPLPPNLKIYAGTAGPRAPWLPFGNQLNDGILSLAEATGPSEAEVMQVPALHTLIMNSKPVFEDIAQVLSKLS